MREVPLAGILWKYLSSKVPYDVLSHHEARPGSLAPTPRPGNWETCAAYVVGLLQTQREVMDQHKRRKTHEVPEEINELPRALRH
ncbi:hypothetical protein J6590_025078 [Homalodisca vitripennis]|nr:hypothetical protein J6590_103987 [Homalodisca vitripennis]KAG8302799.1 hypothetical protein J6590_025078 [Homalodisca vitripennis]